jgi:uncharacterized protein
MVTRGQRLIDLEKNLRGGKAMEAAPAPQVENKALVQASFERWKNGTGGPFELLAPDAEWTIVGSSPLSKTYRSKQEFVDQVIGPFNARMAKPLVPTIRGLYADGDTVIIFFDGAATAKDGLPYRNTYTWYFQMKAGKVIKATAFFDTREFDEFWARVSPTP